MMMIMKRISCRISYSLSLARYGGIKALLGDLLYQLHSTNVYLGFEKDLTEDDTCVSCGIEYKICPGTEDEMNSVFQGLNQEQNKQTAVGLVLRKWFNDLGFQKCYIAREKESNLPCYMVWMISPEDEIAKSRFFAYHFDDLKPGEVLLEGALTFDRFRGKNISQSVTDRMVRLARSLGYRRMITYISDDNPAIARVCEKNGFRQFNTKIYRRFLFTIRRSITGETQHACT